MPASEASVIQVHRIMSHYRCRPPGVGCGPPAAGGWAAGVAAAAVLAGGCAMRITPPTEVRAPQSVFVADYGYHGSLLLPREDGCVREFAYGQWDWFALNRDRWYNAIPAALLPGRAALGTRVLAGPAAFEPLVRQCPAERLLELRVERERARSLLARLEREYEAERGSEVFNPVYGMWFVHHARSYRLDHNCNTVLAGWLEELGCRVHGTRLFAVFELCDGDGP